MFAVKNKMVFLFLTLCALVLGVTLKGALQASAVYEIPSKDQSRQFITQLIDAARKIVNNPNAKENDFGALLSDNAVIQEIARFILGSHARQMVGKQMEDFCEIYKKRLVRIYSTPEKLKTFRNTTYEMEDNIAQEADGTMLVKTLFYFTDSPSSKPAKIYWKVVMKGGKLYVFDILFEGISKVLAERNEYQSIFNHPNKGRGDPVKFLNYLRKAISEQ